MRVVFSLAAAFLIAAAASAAGRVDLAIHDGRITLAARGATLKDILDAWSRAGGVSVVNGDKLAGPPLTIDLLDVPEEQALDTLLRSVSGYLAVPRGAGDADRSRFARIVILPSSTPSRAALDQPPPSPPPMPEPQPAVAPTNVNGVARLIGPDGRPVEDDQEGAAPQPAQQPSPRR